MKNFFTLAILLSTILFSCVFSPEKENFVEVDQNTEAPQINNQTLDLNSDTLHVWKYTKFNFDLTSSKQEITNTTITYRDTEINFEGGKGSFDINPEALPEGTYTLKIKVYTHSGTGSLADKVGAEGYKFENDWVLLIEKPKAPDITITSKIENGFLKFSWNKMKQDYFHSYNLYFYNEGLSYNYETKITDKNTTSYIDSLFVGGKIKLSLWIRYYDENGSTQIAKKDYIYEYPISISVHEDLQNLTFSWNKNPFNCTTYYSDVGTGTQIPVTDTLITLPAPGLGYQKTYDIAFQTIKSSHYLSGSIYHNYINYSLGDNDQIKHKNVVYNPALNVFYFKNEMHIKSSNRAIEQLASYDYAWDYYDNCTLDFSANNELVITSVFNNLVCLNSKTLQLVESKKLSFTNDHAANMRAIKNLNDTMLLIGYDSYFVLYNRKNQTVIDQTVLLNSVQQNYNYDISADGKYAVSTGKSGLMLFKNIDNKKLVAIYQDSNTYYGCFFDPTYPDKLILNCPDDFKIFDCSTLQTEKTVNRFYANPINIDPVTHNMLLVSHSKKKIYVYDFENDILKLEMNHYGSVYDYKLLNNIIFVNAGYHFDISSYVE